MKINYINYIDYIVIRMFFKLMLLREVSFKLTLLTIKYITLFRLLKNSFKFHETFLIVIISHS